MRTPDDCPWRAGKDHVLLRVRLTPKSARDAVEGLAQTAEGCTLQVRVRAVPEDGAANTALENLIARWLGVPKRSVTLSTRTKSRVKSIAIRGVPAELEARIAGKLAELA
jgi:uncharacterized protein YggU (UPF0235/DUF167 family)